MSTRDIADPIAGMAYAVPKDDEFLRKWSPTRKVDQSIINARRQYTDFFHLPGCYEKTTNLDHPPENMSPVNKKIFEVFQNIHRKALEINRNRHGDIIPGTHDYTFFRFTLRPVNPEDTSQNQDWLLQPLEKCKSKAVVSTKVKMELLSKPKVSADTAVVFVRTLSSRETPERFLDDQSFAQGHRTKIVAKALTNIKPISLVHAELLIDAAIERKITLARMQFVKPLPAFWKLPAELRGRIYQLAANAEGDIWPVDIKEYHRTHQTLLLKTLRSCVLNHNHFTFGENLIFTQGLIMPKSIASLVPSFAKDGSFGDLWYGSLDDDLDDLLNNGPGDMHDTDHEPFATPALLRASKLVRMEAIKTLFMQPTFCFSKLSQLHQFVSNTLDDALSSIRKMRFSMELDDLLVIFSLARKALTFDELDLLDRALIPKRWFDPRAMREDRQSRRQSARPWDKQFEENDQVFVSRSDFMRFTHLTIEVQAASARSSFDGTPGGGNAADYAKQLHLGRLLLVKLINLTLDSWASKNNCRPHLDLIWPDNIEEDDLEALNIMGKVYMSTEVTDE